MGLETKDTETKDPVVEDEALAQYIKTQVQSQVDKITAKLGKEKAELAKQLDKVKKEKLTDDEIRRLDLEERERLAAEKERALLEKENRLYAIKSIKAAGLDDGSDKALELVDFVLSDDTDVIDSRVKAFGALVKKFAQSEIDRTFKENGRNPNGNSKSKTGNNPWAKDSFNLTEQMRIEHENPELANQLKAAVGTP